MSIRPTFFSILILFIFFLTFHEKVIGSELIEYEGLIEPFEIVNVGSPVEGVVERINVERSATVQKGEPLVLLESSVEMAVVERARVLAAFEGDVTLQNVKLDYAKRTYSRVRELFSGDVISVEKKDQAATEVALAHANLLKANEGISLAQMDLKRAQAILAQRTIASPISGIVVERYVAVGEFVAGEPLVKIAQMDPLRVEVVLPATMFNSIKNGMKAEVTPETELDGSYNATVAIVDRVIDPASGTFGVRLELPNPDYRLPSGLKCTVRFWGQVKTETAPDASVIEETGQVEDGLDVKHRATTAAE